MNHKLLQKMGLVGVIIGSSLFLNSHQVLASDVAKSMREAEKAGVYGLTTPTSEWQNTPGFARPGGAISTDIYHQADLMQFAKTVAQADDYHGNTTYQKVSTEHNLVQPGIPRDGEIMTFLGKDGVLQIATVSELVTPEILQHAVEYWNQLAGAHIMEYVADPAQSDEVLHDKESNANDSTLMAQTYTGKGIVVYKDNFHQGAYTDEEFNNQKLATVVHELGHALGVSHMGGGASGDNAGQPDGQGGMAYWSEDFMSTWSPYHNPAGVTSTKIDASALAMVATAWEKPRQVGSWVLGHQSANVNMDNYRLTNDTVPKGLAINVTENIITDTVEKRPVVKNYNVYAANTIDKLFADRAKYGELKQVGTTSSLNLLNQNVYVTKDYTATNGNHEFRATTEDNQDIILYEKALGQPTDTRVGLPDWGVKIDGQYLQDTEQHYETVKKNYVVFSADTVNVPKLFADNEFHYLSQKEAVGTTQTMGLIGQKVLVAKQYTAEDGIKINKVILDDKVYYILEQAFTRSELQEIMKNAKTNGTV